MNDSRSYSEAIQTASTTNLISIALLAVSAIVWLLVSVYAGAVIALAAELVAVIPNSKLNKMFKKNGLGSAQKAEMKEITKELKKENRAFAASFIIAMISLILVLFFVCSPNFLGMFS